MRLPSFIKVATYRRFSYRPRYETTQEEPLKAKLYAKWKRNLHKGKASPAKGASLRLLFIWALGSMYLVYLFFGFLACCIVVGLVFSIGVWYYVKKYRQK